MNILPEKNETFSSSLSDTAKILGIKRKDLIELLKKTAWIFKRSGFWLGYEEKVDAGFLIHRRISIKHNSGAIENIPQVRVTNKGIDWLEQNIKAI